jgi:hypothetical protein
MRTILFSLAVLSTSLMGCSTLDAPPARPIPEGTVAVGGHLSGPYPVGAGLLAGVPLGEGALLTGLTLEGPTLQGTLSRRYRTGTGSSPRALSLGLRGGAHLGAASAASTYGYGGSYRSDVPERPVGGQYNGSLFWGGLVGRYALLADPEGLFASASATAVLESQRPFTRVPFCSTEEAPPGCTTDAQARALAGSREAQGRLFLGGRVGYRVQLSRGLGMQLQVGGQVDPIYALGGRGYRYEDFDDYRGWLAPVSLQAGVQLDGLIGR